MNMNIADTIKSKYGNVATEAARGAKASCCGADNSVDVVISNCVINLSADKRRVLAETFRVLKPGGRFAVSDIVRRRALPEPVMRSAEMWAGCVSGALEESEYRLLLAEVGFRDVGIDPTRRY